MDKKDGRNEEEGRKQWIRIRRNKRVDKILVWRFVIHPVFELPGVLCLVNRPLYN